MNPPAMENATSHLHNIDRFFAAEVEAFTRQLSELDAEIHASTVPQWDDRNHRRLLHAFQDSLQACRIFEESCDDEGILREVQAEFRRETDPWFRRSWIANRARTKPSGFAGDYEMLRKLYAQRTPASGLGAYLDFCILDLPLARAVRARLAAAKDFLVHEVASRSGAVRILDIACGPCQEYLSWPRLGNNIEVVAMDSDPKALGYLESEFDSNSLGKNGSLQPLRYNALRTKSAAATIRKFGRFDILYSVGLCDYLSDEHLIGMLSAWRETLAHDGVLYVAFKDTRRYDKTPYQWHLDWHFFQRTEEDVLELYRRAGFDETNLELSRDATGIIINVFARSSAATRVDEAHPTLRIHSVSGKEKAL
jgi:SAM-dependent methyltransferase